MATFFSVTIAVKPPERRDGDQGGWIDKITAAVSTYMSRNAEEGLLVQSIAGGCLTLRGAILFAEAHDRHNLQIYLRTRQVNPGLPSGTRDGDVTVAVSTCIEDAQHTVYKTLRRTAAGSAGQWEGWQPAQPGPPAPRF
jgi:hypothetical protein